jgi:hypothetical protein
MSMARFTLRAVFAAILFVFFVGVFSARASAPTPGGGSNPGTPVVSLTGGGSGAPGDGGDPDEWENNGVHAPSHHKGQVQGVDSGSVRQSSDNTRFAWIEDLLMVLKANLRIFGI